MKVHLFTTSKDSAGHRVSAYAVDNEIEINSINHGCVTCVRIEPDILARALAGYEKAKKESEVV